MFRAISLLSLSALLVVTGTPAAGAETGPPEVDAPAEDRIGTTIGDERPGRGSGAPAPGRPRRSPPRGRPGRRRPVPPVHYVVRPVIVVRDGAPCVMVVRVPGDPGSPAAVRDEARLLSLRRRFPVCPRPARTPRPPESPATDGADPAVRQWADEVQLPAPRLRVRPGAAVVGKAAYLEIEGPRQGRWLVEALGWSIEITADATYTVDWGDGTVEHGITSQGGPWPTGDLRHAYLHGGRYTITVTEHWTAQWVARGHGQERSGTLAGVLRTRGELPDLPVHELQAVRRR